MCILLSAGNCFSKCSCSPSLSMWRIWKLRGWIWNFSIVYILTPKCNRLGPDFTCLWAGTYGIFVGDKKTKSLVLFVHDILFILKFSQQNNQTWIHCQQVQKKLCQFAVVGTNNSVFLFYSWQQDWCAPAYLWAILNTSCTMCVSCVTARYTQFFVTNDLKCILDWRSIWKICGKSKNVWGKYL